MKLGEIQIRETKIEDIDTIYKVEQKAFGYDKEAILTIELLTDKSGEPMVSLLAFSDDKPVGHILFTRAYFSEGQEQPMMHILAPLAVVPEYQRQGVGGMLIKAGIESLRQMGSNLVFVLGHKEYYPRHGFLPNAESFGYPAPYPIPEKFCDYWMVQEISPKGFGIGKGNIKCADAMNKPEHWRE